MIGAHELELLPVSVALDGGAEAPDVDLTADAVGYDLRLHGIAVRIPRTATVTVHYEAGHESANAGRSHARFRGAGRRDCPSATRRLYPLSCEPLTLMRYFSPTLILFALALPCAAQNPYSAALLRDAAALDAEAEAYDALGAATQAQLRMYSAWRAAGGEADSDDTVEWREWAAERREWAASARESAEGWRGVAYENEGNMLQARANATGRYAGLWNRAADAAERTLEAYERTAAAEDRAAAAWDRAAE